MVVGRGISFLFLLFWAISVYSKQTEPFHKPRECSGEGVRGNSMKEKVHRTLNQKKKITIPIHIDVSQV